MIVDKTWYDFPAFKIFPINPEILIGNEFEEPSSITSMVILSAFKTEDFHMIVNLSEAVGFRFADRFIQQFGDHVMCIPSITEFMHTHERLTDEDVKTLNELLQKYISEKIEAKDYNFPLNTFFLNQYFLIVNILREAYRISDGAIMMMWEDRTEDKDFHNAFNEILDPKLVYFPYPITKL